jgi:DNA-directed RNA polymerase specialized sigma24 family protein
MAACAISCPSEVPRLRRFARGLVRDRDISDDLVQDSLVRALSAESGYHERNLRCWLFVIVINLNRNRVRGFARQYGSRSDRPGGPLSRASGTTACRRSNAWTPNNAKSCSWLPSKPTYTECARPHDPRWNRDAAAVACPPL